MPRGILVLLSSLLVACGARGAVDEPSAGGGSGASGAAEAIAACAAYCDRGVSDGCNPTAAPCEEWCPAYYGYMGSCTDEYRSHLECVATKGYDDSPDCYKSTNCDAEGDAFIACSYPAGPCESFECEPKFGLATCDRLCSGSVYTSACEALKPFTCTCSFNGAPIGTCQSIDLKGTCCTQYFALWK